MILLYGGASALSPALGLLTSLKRLVLRVSAAVLPALTEARASLRVADSLERKLVLELVRRPLLERNESEGRGGGGGHIFESAAVFWRRRWLRLCALGMAESEPLQACGGLVRAGTTKSASVERRHCRRIWRYWLKTLHLG